MCIYIYIYIYIHMYVYTYIFTCGDARAVEKMKHKGVFVL